jgi:predicted GIY-YIG superfamily endonuclease
VQPANQNYFVYVLSLQHGKYYVGKTRNPDKRIHAHFAGRGCECTSLHLPLRVVSINPMVAAMDEDHMTETMMHKYGIDNVRGGAFSKTVLPPHQLACLQEKILSAEDKCFHCGQLHFMNECPYFNYQRASLPGNGSQNAFLFASNPHDAGLPRSAADMIRTAASNMQQRVPRVVPGGDHDTCFRCGRPGHWAGDCYARRDVDGDSISSESDSDDSDDDRRGRNTAVGAQRAVEGDKCYRCGLPGHYADECYARNVVTGPAVRDGRGHSGSDGRGGGNRCYRCGREGHYADECYATTSVNNNSAGQNQTGGSRGNSCYRCGRAGHYADECYASTDSRGRRMNKYY